MTLSADFIRQVDEVDPKLKNLFLSFMEEIDVKARMVSVDREDFNDMKEVLCRSVEIQERTDRRFGGLTEAQERTEACLERLAEAQERTEQRVAELTEAQKKLAEAQGRTEARMEELAQAQAKTEIRMEELAQAQARTEIRMEELAQAQARTEIRMEELAQAQAKTEIRLEKLAETQERMGIRIEKLTEAQERTEKSVRALAENQKNMAVQLGGLSMAVGYGIEDKIMPDIRNFVLRQYGIEVLSVDRRNVMYPDGKYDEINLYVEGVKDSQPVFLIGECKAQPGKKDFDRFDKMLRRLQGVLKGDIVPFIVGYHYAPEVEAYADLRHSRISRYKTFQISHPDLNKK